MVLLETAVVAVDGLGTCLFCDVDVTFRGWPLFRSGATGEVFMSLTGVLKQRYGKYQSVQMDWQDLR
ncbi:hypothetical protein TNCV_2246931 [Trichonephila clavipes]|nr:hypothetical protein TNCV_2246931 [Trichonephila clavipes]